MSNTALPRIRSDELNEFVQGDAEDIRKERLMWSIDHGFEFVEIDYENPNAAPVSDEDELDGLPRILEALQCNSWRNMIRKGKYTSLCSCVES